MNWINLKSNKCPKCFAAFGFQAFSQPNVIICPKCKFAISHKRFSEIVNSQVTAGLNEKYEEEEDLNLG